jgi:tRNA-specific 2-thiouridylase
MKHVYVGLSGGVDSSVTAAMLLEQGYQVTGVFMKNWTRDIGGFVCPWREDLTDAKRVAVQLGIDFKVFDFESEYKQHVVDYMIEEYQAGRTPNPDIMCNQEVKFKLFLQTALADGADLIATGHYARTSGGTLLKAVDQSKDQTYFLYRVTAAALRQTLYPLGELQKSAVRQKAAELGLVTADKPDSMGICFVGEVGIQEFLREFIETEPGPIIDKRSNTVIGEHQGAAFYTIGQRHGLNVGGGLPYYVTSKDMSSDTVYVTTKIDDDELWSSELKLTDLHWINHAPEPERRYQVRLRHGGRPIDCQIKDTIVHLADPQKAISPGQSAVIYDQDVVLGGGIIS